MLRRSPVLSGMLGISKSLNVIEIKDVSHVYFYEMVRFLYYERIENFCGNEIVYLNIARKYGILDLLLTNTQFMQQNLNPENYSTIMKAILDDSKNKPELKTEIHNYIAR
jgi:hypothetical protein